MAALQCDICGGKLMGRPGGIFECDSCGMQYDTAWAKEKIQEIKGTVKVEGTVEVTGTVKVDGAVKVEGGVTVESLLKRIQIFAQDKEFVQIPILAEQILNMDPECGEAYLWLLMAEKKVQQTEELFRHDRQYLKKLSQDKNWQKALRYCAPEKAAQLQKQYDDTVASFDAVNDKLQQRYNEIQPAQGLIHEFYGGGLAALKSDGTVYVTCDDERKWLLPATKWQGIQKLFSNRFGLLLGLSWDGTVQTACEEPDKHKKMLDAIAQWKDIVTLSIKDEAEYDVVVGLRNDGTLLSAYLDPYQNEGEHAYEVTKKGIKVHYALNAKGWTDVKDIHLECFLADGSGLWNDRCYLVLGLTEDGHIRVSDLSGIANIGEFWKFHDQVTKLQDVVKHCSGMTYLFRDGSLMTLINGNKYENGPFLDYGITKGGIARLSRGYETTNAVAESGSIGLLADGSVDAATAEYRKRLPKDLWHNMVAVQDCGIGEDAFVGIREDGVVLLSWHYKEQPGISVKAGSCLTPLLPWNRSGRLQSKKPWKYSASRKKKKPAAKQRNRQGSAPSRNGSRLKPRPNGMQHVPSWNLSAPPYKQNWQISRVSSPASGAKRSKQDLPKSKPN